MQFELLKDREPGILTGPEHRHFSLALPIVNNAEVPSFLFEIRSRKLKQPGEICFPGGRVEEGESYYEAAVREICEELLINREHLSLICPLDTYVMPSGLCIHPYLFSLSEKYKNTYSPDEVEQVFTVPVSEIVKMKPDIYMNRVFTVPTDDFPFESIPGRKEYPWFSGRYSVYMYPPVDGRLIWGLTAKILAHAADVLAPLTPQ